LFQDVQATRVEEKEQIKAYNALSVAMSMLRCLLGMLLVNFTSTSSCLIKTTELGLGLVYSLFIYEMICSIFRFTIRYYTIAEFNVDSKAEYTA